MRDGPSFHRILQFRRGALLVLAAVVFAGCAGHTLHRDGMAFLEEGRVEEGLKKLEEATKADPGNVNYRRDWLRNREHWANRLQMAANTERAAGRLDAAEAIYRRLLKMDPNSTRASLGLEQIAQDRRHEAMITEARSLFDKGNLEGARSALQPILLENSRHGNATALQRQIDERSARESARGPSLREAFKKPVTLQFRDASVKMVFEALSRTSGINVLVDKDVKPDLKTSIFVRDVSVEDAIDLILLQGQLEKKIISDNTVFVYPNTLAKIKDYQDLKIRSFHLTHADPKQILTMIKTLLKTKDIFVNEKTNSIVMRDTPEAIRLAEKMVADQDVPDPEVMLEVEVLEISRSRLSEIGIKYPTHLTLTARGGVVGADTPTVNELRRLNGGNIVTSPALSATINLLLQDGETNLLASPRIRARNREKAKIMIGDRVPVITNAVTPVSTGAPVITGSVQYLDVGLKLEVEPEIHKDNEITIKVGLEVSSIVREVFNAVSGTLSYQVGTRNTSTALRLSDGETQILAGLISDEDRHNANKVPALGQLPIIGRLFASHKDDTSKTEIILSITPHIVGNSRLPEGRAMEYWSGTESTMRVEPVLMKPAGGVSATNAGGQMPASLRAPEQPAQPFVFSWDGPNQAKVGDRISLTLSTQPPIQERGSLGFLVGFDPAVLKPIEVSGGEMSEPNERQAGFTRTIDQASGQILVDRLLARAGGRGRLATIAFEVTAASPRSPVTLGRINVSGAAGEALPFMPVAPHFIEVTQ